MVDAPEFVPVVCRPNIEIRVAGNYSARVRPIVVTICSCQSGALRITHDVGRVLFKRIAVSFFGAQDVIVRRALQLNRFPRQMWFQLPAQKRYCDLLVAILFIASDHQQMDMIGHQAYARSNDLLSEE